MHRPQVVLPAYRVLSTSNTVHKARWIVLGYIAEVAARVKALEKQDAKFKDNDVHRSSSQHHTAPIPGINVASHVGLGCMKPVMGPGTPEVGARPSFHNSRALGSVFVCLSLHGRSMRAEDLVMVDSCPLSRCDALRWQDCWSCQTRFCVALSLRV
ncbi:uncharacterized protein B0I36DRAFT_67997 [Microdochium trichocladiopsis]|uniref:Uncharacterized protein n=1 Tax=Microdochium trichocladiopsis TaxID=1682393 RepID=A0A9P9BS61_9PEZI|nr:uncharacterized protein B0I36DRAFT_67997 [Microdochium trichocladiopsis]KAH7037570.1 hypothetical protein B0I36DRAFT_67997 [Microdochium trichocladiopsis]